MVYASVADNVAVATFIQFFVVPLVSESNLLFTVHLRSGTLQHEAWQR